MQPSGSNGEEPRKEIPKVTSDPIPSGGPSLPIPNIPIWTILALGSIVCLTLPLYKKIPWIKGGGEKAAETALETVEKVAEVAEKVAADIADALPAGSILKQEVLEVEEFAEEVEKGAEMVEGFIHNHKVNLEGDFIVEGETTKKETENKEMKKNDSST